MLLFPDHHKYFIRFYRSAGVGNFRLQTDSRLLKLFRVMVDSSSGHYYFQSWNQSWNNFPLPSLRQILKYKNGPCAENVEYLSFLPFLEFIFFVNMKEKCDSKLDR